MFPDLLIRTHRHRTHNSGGDPLKMRGGGERRTEGTPPWTHEQQKFYATETRHSRLKHLKNEIHNCKKEIESRGRECLVEGCLGLPTVFPRDF